MARSDWPKLFDLFLVPCTDRRLTMPGNPIRAAHCTAVAEANSDDDIAVRLTLPNSAPSLGAQAGLPSEVELDPLLIPLIHALAEAAVRRENRRKSTRLDQMTDKELLQ